MRIPTPGRLGVRPALLFALLLFLGQQAAGTDIVFSLLTLLYLALFVTGFNLGGGLLYPSGAFIFFNGVLTAIFGLTYKVFLFEPGQNTLMNGNKTMLVYCGGMLSMAVASGLNRALRPKRGMLPNLRAGDEMQRIAIGFLLIGVVIMVLGRSGGEGSLGSALRLLNHFVPMSIVLGTTYQFHRTHGKKGTSWVVFAGILILFAQGVVGFSKEGMFTGPFTWLITVIALGYSFSLKQVVSLAIAAFLVIYYLVPYSQYVRTYSTASLKENFSTSLTYLSQLGETRELYLAQLQDREHEGEPHLYSAPQGFFDRLTMLAFDDDLINYTDQGNIFGLLPTFYSYANIVPHVIWTDKPIFAFGNVYGREIGVIPEEDITTGISFSPTGDAYHEATWLGVLVVWPVVVFVFFFITDSLTGSTREAPWALLPIIIASHQAPEGLMSGTIFLSTYGIVALLVMAGIAKYLVPMGADFLRGGRATPKPLPLGPGSAVPRRL